MGGDIMQKEITGFQPLLNEAGEIINPGYAIKPFWEYDREKIKANSLRIKEWDYYLITNDEYGIAFTIADNSYLGFVSVSLMDFKEKTFDTFSVMKFFTLGKFNLPSSSTEGNTIFKNKKIELSFIVENNKRIIKCHIPNFKAGKSLDSVITLSNIPEESMVIATPFKKNRKAFYYNQKINCMTANGYVDFDDKKIDFKNNFGVLDWGRGVWTYNNIWYWGTASGLVDGKSFGINIGYGFGDLSNATENMIFYEGKAHKLDQIKFIIPKKNKKYDFLNEWKFTSNDRRLELTFTPILDRFDKINLGILVSDQHQIFGRMNGYAILDDGTKLEVKNLLGSAEVVHNKW